MAAFFRKVSLGDDDCLGEGGVVCLSVCFRIFELSHLGFCMGKSVFSVGEKNTTATVICYPGESAAFQAFGRITVFAMPRGR